MTTRAERSITAKAAPWLVLALACGVASAALAAPAAPAVTQVTLDGTRVFPESLTSTAAGDLIIGSSGNGSVYRAKAGSATASVWIDSKVSGITGILGVFADEKSNTLYVCSNAGATAAPEKVAALAALRTFDLKTGKDKGSYPYDNAGATLCNDIAVAADGSAYISDTKGGRILKLKKGSKALAEWFKDANLAGIDGLAIGGDGAVVVNSVSASRMFKIPVDKAGAPGAMVELQPSLKLNHPDGLRSIGGNRFLQAESAAARVTELVVQDDKVMVMPIKSDYPGVTASTLTKGRVWFINAKFPYRTDPKLKDQDPGPFVIDSVELPK